MAEIASAFVSLIPSFKGGGAAIAKELGGPAAKAGPEAGKRFGGGLLDGVKGVAGPMAGMLAGLVAVDKIADVFGQALEQGASNAKLGAQLGLNAAETAKAGKVTGAIYADNYGESLDQVNEAAANVVRNIGIQFNSADFQGITGDVLNLATTFDEDLGGVTTAVGTMLRTGLAPNARAALDVITAGMQSGANKADDLLDTFNEYPTQFRNLGLSGQTAMGLLSQGLQGGARDADIVADALKEFSIRSVDGSTATAAGFEAIGLSGKTMAARIGKGGKSASDALQLTLDKLRGIKDPVKRSQAAVALFGTQAEDLGQALYSLDPSKATKALGQVGGAADRMGQTLAASPKAQLDAFKRRVSQTFVGAAGTAIGKIGELGSAVKTKLGAALSGGGALSGLKSLGTSLASLGGPLKAFGATLLPILRQIGSQIMAVVGPALSEIGQIITTQVVPAFRAFLPVVAPIAGFLLRLFGSAIVGALKGVVNVVKGVLTVLAGIFNIFAGIFTGNWSRVWQGIKQVASGIWNVIKGAFQIFINVGLGRVFKLGGALLAKIGRGIWSALSRLFSAGTRAVGSIVSRGVSAVVRFFAALPGKAVGVLASLAGRLGRLFTSAMTRGRKAVTDGVGKLVGKLKEIPGKAVSAIGNLGRTLYKAGAGLIGGLISGIGDKIRALKDKLGQVTKLIPDWKGPASRDATLLRPNGRLIMGGLITGIDDQVPALASTLGGITGRVPGMVGAPDLTGAGTNGTQQIRVYIGERELTDIVRVEVGETNRTTRRRVLAGAGSSW